MAGCPRSLNWGRGSTQNSQGGRTSIFQGATWASPKPRWTIVSKTIAAFADIGEFIDQPVRTYSSGMYVRLAFAVAVNVEPEILVVDEALSVGDSAFQSRCVGRIRDLQDSGAAILLVSHSHNLIAGLCDRALLLHQGMQIFIGPVNEAVSRYEALGLNQTNSRHYLSGELGAPQAKADDGPMMELLDVMVISQRGEHGEAISEQEKISVWVKFRANKSVERPLFWYLSSLS